MTRQQLQQYARFGAEAKLGAITTLSNVAACGSGTGRNLLTQIGQPARTAAGRAAGRTPRATLPPALLARLWAA